MFGRADGRAERRVTRRAISVSARTRYGRKIRSSPAIDSKTTSHLVNIQLRASSNTEQSTSRSSIALLSNSELGNAQWPSCAASCKTCSTPAHARYLESRAIPSLLATSSAVLNHALGGTTGSVVALPLQLPGYDLMPVKHLGTSCGQATRNPEVGRRDADFTGLIWAACVATEYPIALPSGRMS